MIEKKLYKEINYHTLLKKTKSYSICKPRMMSKSRFQFAVH